MRTRSTGGASSRRRRSPVSWTTPTSRRSTTCGSIKNGEICFTMKLVQGQTLTEILAEGEGEE